MKLMTKELRKKFPELYANEHKKPEEVEIIAKFFNPCGAATWWATEFNQEDTFFGYVNLGDDMCAELGYFSLSELESIRLPFGLRIERDLHYSGHTLAEVMV